MNDATRRRRALDPLGSFIVQAPAGSGKTELLIQRYLALLSTVDIPEQILAITFTRKATAQMRGRVLAALTEAAQGNRPEEAHRAETYELACRALSRDRRLEWSLLEQPTRLKIDTLDALNVWLAQRLPIAAGGIGGSRIVENASEHYRSAARRLVLRLADSSSVSPVLRRTFGYADFNADRMVARLARLLSTRDQWIHPLLAGDDRQLRHSLEQALCRSIQEDVDAVVSLIPETVHEQLVALLRHAARHASTYEKEFRPCLGLETLPPTTVDGVTVWKALPELLLTRKGGWRKQPGAVGISGKYPGLGKSLKEVIGTLAEVEGLRPALMELRKVPDEIPGPEWWDAMGALRQTLRHLVAELRVLFAERNTTDFVELALAAQGALGSAARPSDLLLALDRRIRHILVDEFQDTSRSQIRLLELLTSGWEPDDGRSLFLVGDPMQSIYRFRNADMSLFLRAKRKGIGDVVCEPLELTRNFRAGPALIEWVNETFAGIFPQADDLRTGAARFNPCEPTRKPATHQVVKVHALRGSDRDDEIRYVAKLVAAESGASGSGSVAILVRSRNHLSGLQSHLHALGVEAHAVQIEAPGEHQITHDLIGLTRALTHRGDRIAWLGVLRAPWCGMKWGDLHRLCRGDSETAVWSLMQDTGRLEDLSADGRARLERIREIMDSAFRSRALHPLAGWVREIWEMLDGPACLVDPLDPGRADHFFNVLAGHQVRGDLDDPAALEHLFKDPASVSERPRESGVEIMTIHKAKGLEFDTVILPGLGRMAPPEENQALFRHERVHADGDESILMAPALTGAADLDAVTGWLRGVDRRREYAERARLLYVAATRARERLHLVGQIEEKKPGPPSGSLLAFLWPQVAAAFESAESTESANGAQCADNEAFEPGLRRLVDPAPAPRAAAEMIRQGAVQAERRPHFEWASQAALQVGVVVHQWLHTIATDGVENWNAGRIRAAAGRYEAGLRVLGVEEHEIAEASARVVEALDAVLADHTGRWILSEHQEAESELPITRLKDGRIERMRLDRTFVDDAGTRWIIDYKTGTHEGGFIEAFVDSEVERYRAQLERYAETMSEIDSRPVRVGLYFPLLRVFRDWQP